jgi:hypothetical protein
MAVARGRCEEKDDCVEGAEGVAGEGIVGVVGVPRESDKMSNWEWGCLQGVSHILSRHTTSPSTTAWL